MKRCRDRVGAMHVFEDISEAQDPKYTLISKVNLLVRSREKAALHISGVV
jgi:hypothetical protein